MTTKPAGRVAPFTIGEMAVQPGTRRTVDLPVSVFADHTPAHMAVHVVHGARPGPTVFVSAAVHGDEVIGVEIVRRLLRQPQLARLRGTLLAVPVVNAFGFLAHSRYLPDRRDLNRSFPGHPRGSLAARLAYLFLEQVAARATLGIDLHSGAVHRSNLPQLRVSASDEGAMAMARTFAPPVILRSALRDGSLRAAAEQRGIPMLLYEAGEALRFEEFGIRAGVSGCLRVLHALDMIAARGVPKARIVPSLATYSAWLRAPVGGLVRTFRELGETVAEGETIAVVSDPLGTSETIVQARFGGLVIGRSALPVANEGDPLLHVARVARPDEASAHIENLSELLADDDRLADDGLMD